jgi:hypothetical protein
MSAFFSQLADPLLKYAMLAAPSVKNIAESSHGKSTGTDSFAVFYFLYFAI